MKKISTCVLCLFFLISFFSSVFAAEKNSLIAVIGSMDEEVSLMRNKLSDKTEENIQGIKFIKGRLQNRELVIASTGEGKVNAAVATALLIEHYKPAEVIFTGIAGAIDPNLKPGDIVIAEKTAQHDYGLLTSKGMQNKGTVNPIKGSRNPVFFPASKELLDLAQKAAKQVKLKKIEHRKEQRIPKIETGIVVTGDIFVASSAKCAELRQKLGADAVEMEGAAVAQICYHHNTPCIIIRSMSDNADENAVKDVDMFYKTAANNSAALVEEILRISDK